MESVPSDRRPLARDGVAARAAQLTETVRGLSARLGGRAQVDVSVVVPVFNERENLAPLVDEIEQALAPTGMRFEVVVVDDGSVDGSRELLHALAEAKPFLKVVFFRRNCGQSAAFDAGFRYARGARVVTMDGDRQNDPRDIPALLAKLDEGYDFVTGWRRERNDGWLLRKVPSRIANWLVRKVTHTRVHDLGCSLKAYRSDISSELRLYGEMHRFLSVLAEQQGASVAELPVNHRPRTAGTSKYGLGRTFKVLLDLLTVWFLRGFQTKPIYVLGGAGLVMLAGSALTTGVVLYRKLAWGIHADSDPLFLIAVMLALMGVQLLATGLLAEVLIRTYFESQAKPTYPVRETLNMD